MTELGFPISRRQLLVGAAVGGAAVATGAAGAFVDRLAQGFLDDDKVITSLLSHDITLSPDVLMAANATLFGRIPFEFKLPEEFDLVALLLNRWIDKKVVEQYITMNRESGKASVSFESPSEYDAKDPLYPLSTVAGANMLLALTLNTCEPFVLKGYRGVTPLPRRVTGKDAERLANLTMRYSLNTSGYQAISTPVETEGVIVPAYFKLDSNGKSVISIDQKRPDRPKSLIVLLRDRPDELLQRTPFNTFLPAGVVTASNNVIPYTSPLGSSEIIFKPEVIRP